MHEWHPNCTCIRKKYTTSNPPRVYEVARAVGLMSDETINFLKVWGFSGITPSHKVPLHMAIDFVNYYNKYGYQEANRLRLNMYSW